MDAVSIQLVIEDAGPASSPAIAEGAWSCFRLIAFVLNYLRCF